MPDLFNTSPEVLAPLNALLPEGMHPTLREMAEHMYLHLVEDAEAAGLGLPHLADIVMGQIDRVAINCGGSGFYLPRGIECRLSARDREIVGKFNGRNKRELAREYGLSEMRIDQIITAWRKSEFDRRQGKLTLHDE